VSGGLVLSARGERTTEHVTIELRENAPAPSSRRTPEPRGRAIAAPQSDVRTRPPTPRPRSSGSRCRSAARRGRVRRGAVVCRRRSRELREAPVHEIAATELEPLESATVQYEELFLQVPARHRRRGSAEYVEPPDETAAQEPEGTTWAFSHPLASESFERPLPVFEESTVNASSDLQFVEPPSTGTGRREPADRPHARGPRARRRGATALYLRAGATPLARVDDRLEPLDLRCGGQLAFEELVNEFNNGRSQGWELGSHGEMTWQIRPVGQVSCWSFTDDQGAGLMMRLKLQVPTRSLLKVIPRPRARRMRRRRAHRRVRADDRRRGGRGGGRSGDLAGRQRGWLCHLAARRRQRAPRHLGLVRQPARIHRQRRRRRRGDPRGRQRAARRARRGAADVGGAMREVVNAAEGGRLVILGVLAPTSMQALRAIVGRGSAGGDAQTRLALATSFRVAFAYRLLQRLGGGRIAVRDLVVGTSEVSAMLASGDFPGIARLQREGGMSMTTVDDSLARAVRRGQLSLRQAASHAVDKKYLVASCARTGVRPAAPTASAGATQRARAGELVAPALVELLEPGSLGLGPWLGRGGRLQAALLLYGISRR
jgi:twitching motility protein PilT